jgi:hypothetical protein
MSEESQIRASDFTSVSAFVREIMVLLEAGHKLEIIITPKVKERLDNELDGVKVLGRVKVKQV